MKYEKSRYIAVIIYVLFSWFVSGILIGGVVERNQIFIDTGNLTDNKLEIIMHHNASTTISMRNDAPGKYDGKIDEALYGQPYNVEVSVDNNLNIEEVKINDKLVEKKIL